MADPGTGGSLVTLHIYDLTRGVMKRHRDIVFGEEVQGMWHTGVSVYGREYFFEGGITSVPSGKSRFGKPKAPHGRRHVIGNTDLLKAEFEKWVRGREKSTYGKLCYHLVEKNCNHFTNEAVQFLTGTGIPEEILRLPRLVTSAAIGRLFSPHVDRFFGGWQWMILRQHWKHRRRLDRQWSHFLVHAAQTAAPSPLATTDATHRHRKFLACYSASDASATQHFVDLTEETRERKLRVVGRPPPRVYVFGPGEETDIGRLVARLRKTFTASPADAKTAHKVGLDAIIARLEALPDTAPNAAFQSVDEHNRSSGEVLAGRLPEAEVQCFIALLGPLVALWRLLAALSQNLKSKRRTQQGDISSDTTCSSDALDSASSQIAVFEGPGKYFAKPIPRNVRSIMEEFTRRKDSLIALLDAVSRLCLEAPMAKLIIGGHLEGWQSARLFDEKEEPACDQELRQLITGKKGLLGDYSRDFDHLPVPLQVMVLRCFSNVYAAHPSLGRLAALSMATTNESKTLETLGLQTRNALHNKEHAILRLTSASLLTNTVCYLNKELAGPPRLRTGKERISPTRSGPHGAGGSVSSTAAVRGGGPGPHSPSDPVSSITSASPPQVSLEEVDTAAPTTSQAPQSVEGSTQSEDETSSRDSSDKASDPVPMPSIARV